MLRVFPLLLMLIMGSVVYAEKEKDKIEVVAQQLSATKYRVEARGEVVVYYQDAVMKASSATYEKNSKTLILDGNVEIIGYEGSKEHTKHLEIQTDRKEVTFKELFFVSKNDLWLFSKSAQRYENNYTFGTSIFSSCSVDDPLWKITFARSKYDSSKDYMKVYDAKLYFADVPVFYSPYLAFATKQTRSSGLLFPLLGYSEEEGMIYEQSLYWAISESMDLEFNPQIRTQRSLGIYTTFRFVESNHSSGRLRVGYFKDTSTYREKENSLHSEHYGMEFFYNSSLLISHALEGRFEDGLYIDTRLMNDIDYVNLQKTRLNSFGFTPLQESRLNYFLYNENYYTGVNAKYFIDTRKENNDDTMQILPVIQLHKFLSHLIWENLTYKVDFKLKNFDRKEGITLKQAEVKIPLEFTTSFFNDYLHISLGEELYYGKFFFGNEPVIHDEFQYYSNIHRVKLFSDLTKDYGYYIHVLQPSLEYVKPGNENQKPVFFEALDAEQKELFVVGLPEEHLSLSINHYFFNNDMNVTFFQRLTQKYYFDREHKFADIGNEMQYSWKKWKLYSDIVYAPEFGKIRQASHYFSLHQKDIYFTLGHIYKQILPDEQEAVEANDLNFNIGYTLNEKVKLSGGLIYDLDDDSSKQWRFGGSYRVDCWGMSAYIKQEIIPRPNGFSTDNSFIVQFNFAPFVSIGTGGTPQCSPL